VQVFEDEPAVVQQTHAFLEVDLVENEILFVFLFGELDGLFINTLVDYGERRAHGQGVVVDAGVDGIASPLGTERLGGNCWWVSVYVSAWRGIFGGKGDVWRRHLDEVVVGMKLLSSSIDRAVVGVAVFVGLVFTRDALKLRCKGGFKLYFSLPSVDFIGIDCKDSLSIRFWGRTRPNVVCKRILMCLAEVGGGCQIRDGWTFVLPHFEAKQH
jgi:hypothetical protein